ncbi:hypothetical protein JCM33774_65250 [Actinophytocola sp. KF-1]
MHTRVGGAAGQRRERVRVRLDDGHGAALGRERDREDAATSTDVEDTRWLAGTAPPRGGQLGVEREANCIRSHEATG